MEEKDLALLGFIASANDYLKNHANDDYEGFQRINDVDVSQLQEQLTRNIGNSFGNFDGSTNKYLNAGKDAFTSFINKEEKPKIIDEFDEIFNVDFRKINKEKDEKITNHLMSLLKGRTPEDETIDKYAKIIAANCEDTPNLKTEIKPAEKEMDQIFEEIVSHEGMATDTFVSDDDILSQIEPENNPIEEDEVLEENKIDDYAEEVVDLSKDDIHESEFSPFEEMLQEEDNSLLVEPDDSIKTLDDLFESAVEDKKPKASTFTDAKSYQKPEEQKTDDYIARLMNDLNQSDIAEKIEVNRKKEEETNQIYNDIKKVYPYLLNDFIRKVYDSRDSIELEFPYGCKIILLQRIKFAEIEGLRKFVEVVIQHNYLVNVDEEKMIVDVFREMINEEGLIISEIFAIANQGRLLTGDHEGYRVILNEKEGS